MTMHHVCHGYLAELLASGTRGIAMTSVNKTLLETQGPLPKACIPSHRNPEKSVR